MSELLRFNYSQLNVKSTSLKGEIDQIVRSDSSTTSKSAIATPPAAAAVSVNALSGELPASQVKFAAQLGDTETIRSNTPEQLRGTLAANALDGSVRTMTTGGISLELGDLTGAFNDVTSAAERSVPATNAQKSEALAKAQGHLNLIENAKVGIYNAGQNVLSLFGIEARYRSAAPVSTTAFNSDPIEFTGTTAFGDGFGNDTLFSADTNDRMESGDGDDTFLLWDEMGQDTIVGGESGETVGDTIDGSTLADPVNVVFADQDSGTIYAGAQSVEFTEIENFTLTDFNDTVDGAASGGGISVDAGAGNDSVRGGSGADSLSGGDGADTLVGGLGADTLDAGLGDDNVTVAAGDTAVGGGGDDIFTFDTALTAGAGTITINGGSDATNGSAGGSANGDNGDTLDLRGLTNVTFTSNPVDDGTGSYSGTFTYEDDNGDTVTVNFSGIENFDGIVDGTTVSDNIDSGYADSAGDAVSAGNDSVIGGAGNDTIRAGSGDDWIQGGAGNDWILYGAGGDTVWGGDGNDIIDDEGGYDATGDSSTLYGGAGNDTIYGSGNADMISGGADNDLLWGESGDDTIEGGAGDDRMRLGSGRDTIVLSDGSGNDVIVDFDINDSGDGTTVDQLDVSGLTSDGINPVNVGDVTVTDTNGDGTGDAILTFTGGESIMLLGVLASQVNDAAELQAIGIPN